MRSKVQALPVDLCRWSWCVCVRASVGNNLNVKHHWLSIANQLCPIDSDVIEFYLFLFFI